MVTQKPTTEVVTSNTNSISFTLPPDTFAHSRADAVVSLAARQANGAALPAWLAFNPQTGAFVGTAPAGVSGEVVIRVTARDQDGREATTVVRINVRADGGQLQPGDDGQPQEQGQGQGQGRPPGPQGLLDTDEATLAAEADNADTPVAKKALAGKPALAAQFQKFGLAGRQASSADLLLLARKAAASQTAIVPRA